jgi:hypothetical protein
VIWNTFFGEPNRKRDVRPEKFPVPVRPEPQKTPEPERQPEKEPAHVPA